MAALIAAALIAAALVLAAAGAHAQAASFTDVLSAIPYRGPVLYDGGGAWLSSESTGAFLHVEDARGEVERQALTQLVVLW